MNKPINLEMTIRATLYSKIHFEFDKTASKLVHSDILRKVEWEIWDEGLAILSRRLENPMRYQLIEELKKEP